MVTYPAYQVTWDISGDGDTLDSGENISDLNRVLDDPGVTFTRGRDQVRQLAPPAAGRCDLDIDNRSRDYSTENAASPLYGLIGPGGRLTIAATRGATTYPLWAGVVDDVQQDVPGKRVRLPALGTLSRLVGKTVSTPVYQAIRTDQALGYILDAVGWPALERNLGVGKTTLLWWWLDEEDALSAVVRLLNTEGPGAAIYEDGAGKFVFESRHYRLTTARSTTATTTFRDSGTAPYHIAPFGLDAHLKDVINSATIPVNLRTLGGLGVVWSLGATLTLPPYVATQIEVTATSGDPFTGAVTPASGTDYTVTTGSLGAVSLNRTSGARVTLSLTAGAGGATLTGLQLRAQRLTATSVGVRNTIDCAASIARNGLRTLGEGNYPLWGEIDVNVAQDFANAIVAAYRDPRATATVTIQGADDTHLDQCLAREISDRIHVTEYQSGLDSDMYVESLRHTIDGGGRRHTVTLGCEKASAVNQYAVWGSAVWGGSVWAY